jgi:hypothetical protein
MMARKGYSQWSLLILVLCWWIVGFGVAAVLVCGEIGNLLQWLIGSGNWTMLGCMIGVAITIVLAGNFVFGGFRRDNAEASTRYEG